ncbi:hypothetical protein C8R42DRAFT_643883 [Lentinula raphanica]|nr:hypothetical protein C8R42DRAFT_643883 [Lentinula raphanica]
MSVENNPTPTSVEIPTAPPSPSPVRQGRGLRRHDTFFFLARAPTPTLVENNPTPTPVEISTAPPSPNPVRQERALRLNGTILSPARTHTDSIQSNVLDYTDFEAQHVSNWEISDGSRARVDLDECWEEVALQNTPLSNLPPGVSLEQYVRESLNRKRIGGFLAYAYSLEDTTTNKAGPSSTS